MLGGVLKLLQERYFKDPLLEENPLIMWRWLYYCFTTVYRILFTIWGHWKITGRAFMPKKGGVIVASNHMSYVDPPLVGTAIVRPAYFLAKAELFQVPLFGRVIARIGAFPVRRATADRAAVKRALEILKRGEPVVIFPEGTRREPGTLGEAENGFGWIAYRARVPVLPVAVIGSNDLLPRGAKFIKSSHVEVRIGKPIRFDDLWNAPDSRQAMKEIGERTMAAIQALMD